MAIHYSILTWEIPWKEKPGGQQSMELQRVGYDLATKQQHSKWQHITHSWFEIINIFKMIILYKFIYKFNVIHIYIPTDFFAEIDKLNLKFKWKFNGPSIVKPILINSSNVRRIEFPNYKTYYKTTVVNAVWY